MQKWWSGQKEQAEREDLRRRSLHSQETKTAHFPAAGIWRPIQTKGNLPQRRKTGLIGRNRIGGIGKPSGNDRGEPGISPVIGDGRSQDIEIHTGFQKSSKDIRLFRIMADPGSHRLSCKGGSKTLAAERREVEDSRESFLLPVGASQSGRRNALPRCGPVSSEQRELCAFLACAASLNGAMEKAGKVRSAQPVSKDKERNHGYGHICKSGNIYLRHTGRVDQCL